MTQGPDCLFRKVLTFPRMLLNKNKQKKTKTNGAQSVPDMSCVGLNHVSLLTGCKASTPSFSSGQCRPHIKHILTFIHLYASSKTSLLCGLELTVCARVAAISMLLNCIFTPLLPLALSFIIIKVRFMSESLGEVTLHLQTVKGPVKR